MSRQLKSIIIDGDQVFSSMLQNMLEKEDIEVCIEDTLSSALSTLQDNQIDLLFVSFKLLENCDDLLIEKFRRETLYNCKRVILLANSNRTSSDAGLKEKFRFHNILFKPLSLKDIEAVVSRYKSSLETEKHRIAVVDDDDLSAKVMMRTLKELHYDCVHYDCGESFLGSLRDERPSLVLLDILMPGISGIGVLEVIRKKYKAVELPVIMLTARDDASAVVESLQKGANDYIIKPANVDVACARILTQINLLKYYKDSLRKVELETLNSLIVTYNHEINNPLTIAVGSLRGSAEKMNEKKLENAREALERIANIVGSIHKVVDGDVSYVEYMKGQKMLKLGDE